MMMQRRKNIWYKCYYVHIKLVPVPEHHVTETKSLVQWFPKWAVPPPGGRWDYRGGL
jgi:hypothetical protein